MQIHIILILLCLIYLGRGFTFLVKLIIVVPRFLIRLLKCLLMVGTTTRLTTLHIYVIGLFRVVVLVRIRTVMLLRFGGMGRC